MSGEIHRSRVIPSRGMGGRSSDQERASEAGSEILSLQHRVGIKRKEASAQGIQKQRMREYRFRDRGGLRSPEPRAPCGANRNSMHGGAPDDAASPPDRRGPAIWHCRTHCRRKERERCTPAPKRTAEDSQPQHCAATPQTAPATQTRRWLIPFAGFAPDR